MSSFVVAGIEGRSSTVGSLFLWRRLSGLLPQFDHIPHVDINNLVEANRRGDTEYRKLQGELEFPGCSPVGVCVHVIFSIPCSPAAVIAKSKEMQHVSMIMDEKETYAQQVRG
jgi:hypothetical protein